MEPSRSSAAKERILGKIRKGLGDYQAAMPFPEADMQKDVYAHQEMEADEVFATEFIKLGGKFVFCDTEQDLLEQLQAVYDSKEWNEILCTENALTDRLIDGGIDFVHPADPSNETADACITFCEVLVARTGSILLSSQQPLGRIGPVFYPHHIVVAFANQVVPDISDAFEHLKRKYGNNLPSMINLNTGPSRTADIEKTLVVGVHGPKEVYCFFLNASR